MLLDYGSCTWVGAPPITTSLMPPNTQEYLSPEALRFLWAHWDDKLARYPARPADDLYALGAIIYYLVARVYPPPGTAPRQLKEHLQEPLPKRVPLQELNPQVVPQLAAFSERLLAEQPEARGTAREAAEAAASAAEHLGPEADAPLSVPAHAEAVPAPLPVQAASAPSVQHPAAEAVPVPPQTHDGWRSPPWTPRLGLVAASLGLALASTWWMSRRSHEQAPGGLLASTPEAEEAPDEGSAGLGDGGVTSSVVTEELPVSADAVSVDMPKQPLPGQRRAPCRRRGEVEITGGCWVRWADFPPPCGDDAYEWNGICYAPRFERPQRVPNSTKPHP